MADEISRREKWDRRFLKLASEVACWSKDPSTKVGAVIVRPNRRIVSLGYNGFPEGVDDDPARYENRDLKYKMIVHGEMNAIFSAERSVVGCTLYTWPFPPCARCTGEIIQNGIVRVVAPEASIDLQKRWGDDLAISILMLREAGIQFVLYPRVSQESFAPVR